MKLQRGFTIVELILVVMIIGILAAVVGPRFFDRDTFDERIYFEEALSAVRYAQKLAVASGCPIRFQLNVNGYAVSYNGGGCGSTSVGVDYNQELPAGITVKEALSITFNSLGSVNETCPNGVCKAVVGDAKHTFKIHSSTGFIEVGI